MTYKAGLRVAFVGIAFAAIAACGGGGGGGGTTRPYDDITVTPDSVSNGVAYYTKSMKWVGGTSVQVFTRSFKTEGGIWYWKEQIGTSWQPVIPDLTLYTTATYSVKGAEEFVASMGHTIKSWQDQGNPDFYIVKLQEGTATTLAAEVPLIAIIEAYFQAVELFAGVMNR